LTDAVRTMARDSAQSHAREMAGRPGRHFTLSRMFDMLGPIGPPCSDMERFGARDEAKFACGLSRASAPCTVMSFGCNNLWGFEEAVFARTPCNIEVFDCTVKNSVAPPASIAARTRLHRVCVDGANRTERRAGHAFLDWPSLLRLAGLTGAPLFLKIDVEGAEYELLSSMLASGLLPDQIALELHVPSTFTTHKDETRYRVARSPRPWYDRLAAFGSLALFAEEMWDVGGYTIVARRGNHLCGRCTEVLLARDAV